MNPNEEFNDCSKPEYKPAQPVSNQQIRNPSETNLFRVHSNTGFTTIGDAQLAPSSGLESIRIDCHGQQ